MKLTVAQLLADMAEAASEDLAVRDGYSARGMAGKTTSAVVGKLDVIVRAVALAGVQLGRNRHEKAIEYFLEDMQHLSWDDMGQDIIAY